MRRKITVFLLLISLVFACPMTVLAHGRIIVVAVIDSGINSSLNLFKGRVVAGYDLLNDDSVPEDESGHGTYVSSIIVKSTTPNVVIMPLKVAGKNNEAYTSDVIYAIDYATQHGADIINVSMDSYVNDADMAYYEKWVNESNVPIICSAGNERKNLDKKGVNLVPAEFKRTICVSSISKNRKLSKNANYGKAIDFVAPGEGAKVTYRDGSSRVGYGSSFAAPQVTAMAAMLMARGKTDIKKELRKRSVDLGPKGKDRKYGYGCPTFKKKAKSKR